jgi:uncharacterized membrane protein
MATKRRLAILTGIMGTSGVLHFAMPEPYQKIVPPQLGDARTLVLASGAVELACAALLAAPKTRRLGGWLSVGVLIGVFPANLYSVKVIGDTPLKKAAAIARLPLQIPMLRSALAIAREG